MSTERLEDLLRTLPEDERRAMIEEFCNRQINAAIASASLHQKLYEDAIADGDFHGVKVHTRHIQYQSDRQGVIYSLRDFLFERCECGIYRWINLDPESIDS